MRVSTLKGLILCALSLLLCLSLGGPLADAWGMQGKRKGKTEKKQGKDDEGGDLEEGQPPRELLTVAAAVQQTPSGEWEIVVRGTARMPDRLELQVSLHFDTFHNDPLEIQTHIPISSGGFGVEEPIRFGPYDRKSTANGVYWVVARFRLADQADPDAVASFKKALKKWEQYVDFSAQAWVRLGSPGMEAREDRQRRDHYLRLLVTLLEIRDEFDEGLVSALRAGFPSGSEWRQYVKEKAFLPQVGAVLNDRLDELKKKGLYVKGGKLDVDEWREFLDRKPSKEIATHPLKSGGLRGRILRIRKDHQDFQISKLGLKMPRANELLDKLTASLYAVTMRWSRVVYKRAGLGIDSKDASPQDPIPIRSKGSHKEVKSLAGALEREIETKLKEE